MAGDPSQVVVSIGGTAGESQVNHHDFPEIRAQGQSRGEAAHNLANQLRRALDSALTNWRRETIQKAIADVEAFAQQED